MKHDGWQHRGDSFTDETEPGAQTSWTARLAADRKNARRWKTKSEREIQRALRVETKNWDLLPAAVTKKTGGQIRDREKTKQCQGNSFKSGEDEKDLAVLKTKSWEREAKPSDSSNRKWTQIKCILARQMDSTTHKK
jgi:hypothetical protein